MIYRVRDYANWSPRPSSREALEKTAREPVKELAVLQLSMKAEELLNEEAQKALLDVREIVEKYENSRVVYSYYLEQHLPKRYIDGKGARPY